VNVVRHTLPGTPVWVRVEREPLGALITVEDAGPGVPEDMRKTVFESFRRGPGTRPYSPGVGIGLALVASFAELHGGRAWVEERAGGGASFRVLLPDAPSADG
jgi:two-component system sensor histidine kinase MtrB